MVLNARVLRIESGKGYTDGLRRVTLRFEDGAMVDRDVQLPYDPKIFGTYEPRLDDVLCFESVGVLASKESQPQKEESHET